MLFLFNPKRKKVKNVKYSSYEKEQITKFFEKLTATDGLRYVHFNLDSNDSKLIKMTNSELLKIDYRNMENTFFTPNTFGWRRNKGEEKSHIARDYKHLDKLCSLYVDLDLKNSSHPENYSDEYMDNIERVYYYIRTTLVYTGVLPTPTAYICSGNGLHLYWSIDSVKAYSDNNLNKWKSVQNYIYETLSEFGADGKVSSDPTRIMRIPYTINKKDGETKKSKIFEMSNTDVTYSLDELIDTYNINVTEHKQESKKVVVTPKKKTTTMQKNDKVKPNNRKVVPFLEKWTYVAEKRANDIEYLLLNFECEGRRETALFLYRYYMCQSTKDTDLALEKTLELNSRIANPLSEREVVRATRSAQKYYENGGFNVTNGWIIEQLNITQEEQIHLYSILSSTEKARRKANRDRERYEQSLKKQNKTTKEQQLLDRRLRVAELKDAGYTQKQIADFLEVSVRTVKADYKVIETEEFQHLYEDWKAQYNEKETQTILEGATFFTHKLYPSHTDLSVLSFNSSSPPIFSSA